uniref:5'-nucleotidase, cytosolic IAb n=1 Tax=Sinocyclocheilus rhinocerous TaxID=307959 RepID=A0A673KCK4_9TELE
MCGLLSICNIMFIQPKPQNAITIAVSSRALLDREQDIYEHNYIINENLKNVYNYFNLKKENIYFCHSVIFLSKLQSYGYRGKCYFSVLCRHSLMTSNHAHVGLRLINSINHYQLFIERFCMTGVNSPIGYLKAYHTNLYLSANFSETHGLDKFFEHEKAHENKPLDHLWGNYPKDQRLDCPIRTYLVTARSAASSGTGALKTLRSWGLETDEALFLAGAPKSPMLEKIRPHIFFDDQMFHVEGAAELGTVAAHVPYGIAQKFQSKTVRDVKKRHVSQAARVNTALSIRGVTSDPFKSGFYRDSSPQKYISVIIYTTPSCAKPV